MLKIATKHAATSLLGETTHKSHSYPACSHSFCKPTCMQHAPKTRARCTPHPHFDVPCKPRCKEAAGKTRGRIAQPVRRSREPHALSRNLVCLCVRQWVRQSQISSKQSPCLVDLEPIDHLSQGQLSHCAMRLRVHFKLMHLHCAQAMRPSPHLHLAQGVPLALSSVP